MLRHVYLPISKRICAVELISQTTLPTEQTLAYLNGDKCEFFKSKVSNPTKTISCVDLFHKKEILEKKENLNYNATTVCQIDKQKKCHILTSRRATNILKEEQPASTKRKRKKPYVSREREREVQYFVYCLISG